MTGNRTGGIQAAASNKKNDPLFYKKIGAKGGAASTGFKGFATNRELAAAAGKLGGHRSRRGMPPKILVKLYNKLLSHLEAVKVAADLERAGEKS